MKRLFAIKNNKDNKLVKGLFFEKKPDAKLKRDELNGPPPTDYVPGTKREYSVVPGPDHKRFK